MRTKDAEDIRMFLERAKNRRNARKFVEKYNWDDIVDIFEVEIKRLKLKEDLEESS